MSVKTITKTQALKNSKKEFFEFMTKEGYDIELSEGGRYTFLTSGTSKQIFEFHPSYDDIRSYEEEWEVWEGVYTAMWLTIKKKNLSLIS